MLYVQGCTPNSLCLGCSPRTRRQQSYLSRPSCRDIQTHITSHSTSMPTRGSLFLAICAAVAVLTVAQYPGHGISKSTYSCNDPLAGKSFMEKYDTPCPFNCNPVSCPRVSALPSLISLQPSRRLCPYPCPCLAYIRVHKLRRLGRTTATRFTFIDARARLTDAR